jgi:hypothetical protein
MKGIISASILVLIFLSSNSCSKSNKFYANTIRYEIFAKTDDWSGQYNLYENGKTIYYKVQHSTADDTEISFTAPNGQNIKLYIVAYPIPTTPVLLKIYVNGQLVASNDSTGNTVAFTFN